jgi:hypothetical protein
LCSAVWRVGNCTIEAFIDATVLRQLAAVTTADKCERCRAVLHRALTHSPGQRCLLATARGVADDQIRAARLDCEAPLDPPTRRLILVTKAALAEGHIDPAVTYRGVCHW